jgi:hypothetical protein
LALALVLVGPRIARAGVEDWEINEIHLQSQSDTQLRFVELVNLQGGCLFPSSTLHLYGGDGSLLDIVSLAQVTTCYGAPTYLLLATPEASAFFAVGSDFQQLSELPSSGQLCFNSSATHYDCVRWGTVTTAVTDLFGSTDTSVVAAPQDGASLARIQSTHIVSDDWISDAPTPRAPNDGSPWTPPDAGPSPDAAPLLDAGPLADAAMRSDAMVPADAEPDARNTRYLDLDAVGGDCGCSESGNTGTLAPLLLLLFCYWRTRRRSAR